MWRNWNTHTLLQGMWNGAATLGNSLAVPQTFQYRVTIWYSTFTPQYRPTWALLISEKWTISTWKEQRKGKREERELQTASQQELIAICLSQREYLTLMNDSRVEDTMLHKSWPLDDFISCPWEKPCSAPTLLEDMLGWTCWVWTLWKMEEIFKSNVDYIEFFALPTD